MRHFINLTNGLGCPHVKASPSIHFTRIQSTHCEQKRWDLVIYGAGPDLLMALASGESVIVHDRSERDRETRACWQGLPLIRRACELYWSLPVTRLGKLHRGGLSLDRYLTEQVRQLPDSVVNYIRYYRRFDPIAAELYSCYSLSLALRSRTSRASSVTKSSRSSASS